MKELTNIDPGRIEAAITPRTRAVIAVHLYAQPADIDAIDFDRPVELSFACLFEKNA